MREDDDNVLLPAAEDQEIIVPEDKPIKKVTTQKAVAKKPAAKAKRAIGKPTTKAKAPKAAKPKKAKVAKAPKEKKVRSAFVLSGTRETIKIDGVFLKYLQAIANELELPSIGHALDKVVGTGLTRLAALARYGAKQKS